MATNWKNLNPISLREHLLEQPWPQAFGVLAEQAADMDLIPPGDRILFKNWLQTTLSGISAAPGEQFFIGLRKFAGKQMLADAEYPLRSYVRWGYLGRDLLVNKAQMTAKQRNRTIVSAAVRKKILNELMKIRKRLTVQDYRDALENQVSRRQAEIDLSEEKRLIPHGQTRGRFYRVK